MTTASPSAARPGDVELDLIAALLAREADWTPSPGTSARRSEALAGLALDRLLPLVEQITEETGPQAAAATYRAWLMANPASEQAFAAWFNLGVLLVNAGELRDAAQAYRQARALRPEFHAAAINLGLALERMGQPEAALDAWTQALQDDAARTALLNQRGRLLEERKRYVEAERALRASLLTDPDQPDVIQHWSHLRQKSCAWPLHGSGLPGLPPETLALQAGPLGALALTDDVALQVRIAGAWLQRKVPPATARLSPSEGYRHARIRLGYLSSDFCRHAMGFLIAGVLERHDRADFEVFGYCSSPEDGSAERRRILAALDHHVPIAHLTDEQAARRIRADEIDILVDLNGLTRGARLHCLRWKPAPVQATYLGYVGPVPLPELDWLICDDFVVPPENAAAYRPSPLPLAGLYQANDSRRPELPVLGRAQEGLPAAGFVFCCFSNHYKITEPIFAAWLDILRGVDGSSLWLTDDNDASRENLRRVAEDRGIAADRLIFTDRVDPARYLARLGLADLFLDTFPYNAGTVASDALRMGLPLITLAGQSFASRMAGGLLRAVGLEDCIASDLRCYTALAIDLARTPSRLARLREVLAGGNAWSGSIGDTAGFTARLEEAYRRIRVTPPDAMKVTRGSYALPAGAA